MGEGPPEGGKGEERGEKGGVGERYGKGKGYPPNDNPGYGLGWQGADQSVWGKEPGPIKIAENGWCR